MCTCCGAEKYFSGSMIRHPEYRYGLFFLTPVCYEEEVLHEVNYPIYGLARKESEFLTIDGNCVDEIECMFEQGV